MAPTSDEERKLRLFSGDLSQLGPADSFLKALVDIPLAFKRMEALLFMGSFKEELGTTMESFSILEVYIVHAVALLILFLSHES